MKSFILSAVISDVCFSVGSLFAALSCLVCVPPRGELRGRSAGSFPEQRLVIEPSFYDVKIFLNRYKGYLLVSAFPNFMLYNLLLVNGHAWPLSMDIQISLTRLRWHSVLWRLGFPKTDTKRTLAFFFNFSLSVSALYMISVSISVFFEW